MPFLNITSNADISPEDIDSLLREGAAICCEVLGKPADYMQTAFNTATDMNMGSRQGQFAFGEVRSIGLPGDSIQLLSEQLSTLLAERLQVPKGNIYLVFQDIPADKWAWDGKTFG
ncbi:MAG: hypothetical protein HOD72_03425 [Opitutae bacterium]|jgi:phenylpyruvate tautomerase PptA (4-oxalocrotonate tautomerase family)|nr:hypothetical protein [Opitutae bacterium]MBT4223496.1 hypothetical protein [Opitutae bacterium]MBT6463632.1 hypothetical protein [Opitutae bacterium]